MTLGKITKVNFSYGGYQDAMFGVTFILESNDGCCSDFWGTWAHRSKSAEWSKESQIKKFGEVTDRLIKLCDDAKVGNINELKGKPVEIIFKNNTLSSWRILKEVL